MVLAVLLSPILSLALPSCQFPDYGFSSERGGSGNAAAGSDLGPAGEGGEGGAAGGEAGAAGAAGSEPDPPPVPCPAQACVPGPPPKWRGPVALWIDKAGEPPKCPAGYGQPMDLHRDLVVPVNECTCTCSAQDQVCDANTTLHIYTDMGCSSECATVTPLACNAVSGCSGSQGSMRAALPTPTGGSCRAKVSDRVDPTWKNDVRLCLPSRASICDDTSQVCAPTPDAPYLPELCVMKESLEGQSPPACPAGFPNQNTLYASFADERSCTECGCGSVTGGKCSGSLTLSGGDDCRVGEPYQLGSNCKPFNLGPGEVHPSHVLGEYTVSPGACSVVTPAQPIGSAAPDGTFTVVCCQ